VRCHAPARPADMGRELWRTGHGQRPPLRLLSWRWWGLQNRWNGATSMRFGRTAACPSRSCACTLAPRNATAHAGRVQWKDEIPIRRAPTNRDFKREVRRIKLADDATLDVVWAAQGPALVENNRSLAHLCHTALIWNHSCG
jgi:hypothetical protein